MTTSKATIAALLDGLAEAGPLRARAMFGEYALYLEDKVVALVCDDLLWLKLLPEARALLPDHPLGAPYPGARPHICLEDALDQPDLAATALRRVAAALPPPKPRKPRRRPA
ncbi:TfoX/Sxy family protein [Gemmobacter caeruleus]|uniref:TfoX/Sxy family protein n=1 Tax=Gemmobacter caeruleus TaxID=2595004 RepID=UPI0011EFEFF6|nr:TfoX/Sxy family protein [Gemmobacter caeruleus]